HGGDQPRPQGRRFGALVHLLLATVDLDSTSETIAAAAAVSGRVVSATEEEVTWAAAAVVAALNHPLLRLAAASEAAGNLRRETPIILRREDGLLVEGVADLAFRQDLDDFTGWTVIDFKTDREFGSAMAKYTAQLGLYLDGIEGATGGRARGFLLVI